MLCDSLFIFCSILIQLTKKQTIFTLKHLNHVSIEIMTKYIYTTDNLPVIN